MADSRLKRLYDKREAVAARIRKEENKLRSDERKDDTRRKILAGAVALEWGKRDSDFYTRLMSELARFLVKDNDRALFNLPPLQNLEKKSASGPLPGA